MADQILDHVYKLKGGEQEAVERNNPFLERREPIVVYCKDGTTRMKIGDGIHYYNELAWSNEHDAVTELAQAFEKYKLDNNARVDKNTQDIATIFEMLEFADGDITFNGVTGITINGEPLPIIHNIVDIPSATEETFGVIKLGDEFQLNESGELEVKEINVNKLTQDEDDILILSGGTASHIK